jgi:hypothetical protein
MNSELTTVLRKDVCKDLMLNRKCLKEHCEFIHGDNNSDVCFHHWKFNSCKYNDNCKKLHLNYSDSVNKIELNKNNKNNNKKRNLLKIKNTESFKPMEKPVDARILLDTSDYKSGLSVKMTDRDIVLIPNLFRDYSEGIIYDKLMDEINESGIPQDKLFKLWHGDTHLIADDRLQLQDKSDWKTKIPTFNMVIDRIRNYFNMDIKATRLNYYKDTSQFKPFHFDAAAMKPEKEKTQNFTIGVSFGVSRDVAFEHDTKDKTVISIPLKDGEAYAFCKVVNTTWRHGVLQDVPVRDEGRISIICWGQVNY